VSSSVRHVQPGPEDRDRESRKRDRQMIELLNELRVALPGVQILFAFLLTVPFSQRFEKLTGFQRDVYYLTLMATAVSTACLIAPSAAHRLRFHKGDRAWLVESANALTIAGLVTLAIAITGAVTLITDILFDGLLVWLYAGALAIVIVGLWFARPLLRGDESSGP
jgi:Family of unknown function (DUF6328)